MLTVATAATTPPPTPGIWGSTGETINKAELQVHSPFARSAYTSSYPSNSLGHTLATPDENIRALAYCQCK